MNLTEFAGRKEAEEPEGTMDTSMSSLISESSEGVATSTSLERMDAGIESGIGTGSPPARRKEKAPVKDWLPESGSGSDPEIESSSANSSPSASKKRNKVIEFSRNEMK